MYRIESIVTSIILSYVDRYIKNFRRQDAQVSLWQGDGVFHNLDLDLEVLEQELNLPFSFVSGHINELLIHVPWTRIASEPVQITINTIECVMKLCPPGGRPAPPPERIRRQQSQPPDEQTSQSQSYRSGLVNKLICNLSITCNNFILKYVEEDIVLSMNIKNLSLSSVNEKWEPEITELSATSLILRKLISLSDITICLDKRNASGRIESYMEPLLYRCFLTIRLSRLYASPTATKAMSTRMDVFCEKMAFTLSESQVPMLMRMFALALALQRKQLTPQTSLTNMADNNPETSAEEHGDVNENEDSWSTWVWSFVPSILPLSDDENIDEKNQSHTFHFGFYIDNFTLALKFCNVLIDLRGCLMELESHDSDWTNMQAGVSQIIIEPSGDCCCGTSEQNQVPYLTAGSHQDSFLSGSLFGGTGTKITERSWDYHLATVTETALLEKSPAFAMDYLFSIEKQPYLVEDDEDFEERNKNPLERVLLRYVADHIVVRVCSGVVHRTQMIMKAASTYDYSPYSTHYTSHMTVIESNSEAELPNLDDVKLVIPQHTTRFTLFHPSFEIYPANHSPVQPSALGRKLSRSKSRPHISPVGLPTVCLVIKWDCLDAKLTRPLTPDKVKLLSAFKPTELTTEILNDSDTRFTFKAVGISSFIKMETVETAAVINVLELNKLSIDRAVHNLACRTKSDVSTEIQVHIENFLLTFSKPKLLLSIEIINSLVMSNNRSRYQVSYNSLFNTSLVQDAAIVSDIVYLKLAMDKLALKQVLTGMSESIQVCVNSCQGFALQLTDKGQHKQTMILDAPNTNTTTPLLTGIFQRPTEDSQHAPVLMFSLHGVRLSADPLIYSWLLYAPIQFPSAKTFHSQFVPQTSVLTTTGPRAFESLRYIFRDIENGTQRFESARPAESSSKGRRVSDGSLGSMMKRAPTPQESIHSSETRSAQLSSQQLVTESIIETTQPTLSEKITNLFPIWQTVVVSMDIADLSVYFPNNTLSSTLPQPMETDLQNALQTLSPLLHVAVFKAPSVTLRCASLKQSLVETRLPVIFPTAIWSADRSNFPWSLNVSDLQCFTLHGGTQLQLLKPFSATCTVGVSTKYNNTALTSLALCVHLDTTAISIAISEEQVALLANLAVILAEVYQTLMPNWSVEPKHKEDTIFSTDPVVGSEDSPSNSLPEEDQIGAGSLSGPVKLTGFLQWTLARLTVSVYNHQTKNSPEKLKLTLDVEDIFISLDIEKVYHKLKLKVATASVQHYLRPASKNCWEVGPFEGLVMRGHDPDGLRISTAATSEENTPNSSGFLTATLTRAYCSNLHSKLATSAKTSKVLKKAVVEDRFITEIEVKLQPLDFVLSPTTLGTILNVLNPILQLSQKKNSACSASPAPRMSTLTYFTSSSLPLLYLDLMAVRIVLCVSEKTHCHHDVVLIQFDSVSTNPQPENPLCRIPVRPDIYQAAEKHRILGVPGSEIEDRQYQLDVVGLSVSTGSWQEIRSMLVKDAVPILQNPALDWNEGRRPSSTPSALENLCPLIPAFNVCLVLAPAIIYQGNTVVCGHSTEVNAVSEITVALSVEQVELFGVLVRELIQILPKHEKDSISTEPRLWFPDRNPPIKESLPYVSVHRDSMDSGVKTALSGSHQPVIKDIISFKGSMDLNTVSFTKGLSSISPSQSIPPTNSAFSLGKRFAGAKENSVPLEILITGSGLSCSIYSLVNGTKSNEIHPLLHIRISQPHTFLSRQGDTLTIQASIFDMSAKSGMTENLTSATIVRDKLSPKVFPQILIETRNGEPDLLTGIPPALLSVKWNRISTKPAKLDIDIGRPVRFIISLDSLNYVRDVSQKLACKWNPVHPAPVDELIEVDVNDDIDSGIKEESHSGYKANYRKKYCSFLNVISVSTQKMVAVFLTKNPDDGNVSLSVDGITLTTNLSQHSFSNVFTFRAATVATQTEGKTKLLINPWSLSINVSLFWESWLQSPTLQISANSDFLNINIAPDTLQCLKQVYIEYYNYYLKETSSNSTSQQTTSNYVIDQELEQEQHYKEDLQAGAFQFVDGGDDRDELPLTYQVVFWTGCHQNPTMAWRYPQPRALTRLFIQPLPFRDSQPGDKVDCCLQYWSECHGSFKDYISFSLCESLACTVALPTPDPLPVVASIWRVVLGSAAQCYQLPINVKALAACLRVDSYFCLSLIPRLQAAINLSSAKVSIWTEVNTMRPMPAQLSRYSCDGLIPSSHNVMIFSLCQTNTSYCKWKQGHLLLTCDGKPRADILNYRTLCMLCCVEPFRFTSRLSVSSGSSQSVNVITEGVTCRIGPAICHTLNITAQLWSQYSTSIPQHLIIMTPFVICNNSHLPIRFGQAETKEVITLQCMQCHLYSWFSNKSTLGFRFSLVQTNGSENWSKPVLVHEACSQLISVCDEESRDWNLVISTRPISSFVTEVMISGQLVIQNTMDCDVEMMVSCERQNSMLVPAKSTPPGIILSPHYAPFLRIRFPGLSFTWSGQIPLKNESETTLKQWLVKVPLRNKEEFNSIWCHLVWDSPNTSGRIFVCISSMYRISSLLPCGAYAHIETPELDSMKSAVIVGSGLVQDLACPGTPEHSHFLTFQLEGKTLPSSSKVPVSYSVIEPRLPAQNSKLIDMNELIEKALSNEEPTNYPISGCTSAQWTSAGQQETVVLVKVDYSSDFIEPRSLQVEVSPWALLINSLGCHLCLQANNQTICSLPHLSVIAPPTIESTFHLGLYIGTAMYLSYPLQLARDHSFYMPHISGIIPLEGCINTTVDCGSIVSYVNIASIDMKGTRLLHVRASYVIANFSACTLKTVAVVVRRNPDDKGKPFSLPRNLDVHTITLQPQNPRARQNKGHPLTEWLSVGVGDPAASYLSISLGGEYSCPVPVPESQERESVPVLVPLSSPDQHINSSLLLCSEVKDGQTFITLWNQDWPQIIVHNHTTLTLALAKAKTDKGGAAEEHNPDWLWQLSLPPGCSADYYLPSCNEQLAQNDSRPSPMVVIAVVEPSKDLVWSEAISLSPCRGRLLRLSGTSGFNVAVNNRGFTTHIILSHMNHTEISPLDVRLRLMQESQNSTELDLLTTNESQSSFQPVAKPSFEIPAITDSEERSTSVERLAIESENVNCISCPDKSCLPGLEDVTCFLQNITVIVGMESSSACDCREVAAFVMDDIGFTIQPTNHPESEAKELLIRVTLGDIQFDNQEYSSGGYDFPVVLMIQSQGPPEPQHVEFSINGSVLTLVELSRTKGSALDLVLTLDVNSYRTPALQDASLTLKPFKIYIEDTYLIELKKILEKIVPTNSFSDVQSSMNKEQQHLETPKAVAKSVASSSVATEDHVVSTEAGCSSSNTKQNEDEERDEELFNVSEPEQDIPSFGLLPEKVMDNENTFTEVASRKSVDSENSRLGSDIYIDKEETEEYLCNLIIPKEIIAAAQELAFPLRLRSLTISPLSVLVSLHTSTTFYIAIDHSPLNFSSFKRGSLVTTAYRLGHALTLHYFLGAFYGSAWALVSLELLGAPGGLARTVGSGVRDFLSLPYHGIQQGPRAFLLGIAHGSASLMKHVTAGTITSVTKLAASWARTLDRLTLDRNDLMLSEESRRHRPEGLTQGLMHGLSEFGTRLLGAVGSIVHQPLQYAISPDPSQSLANSIGLGVVGVFARPLSGAAELVARTGEGILSGAGWSSLPKSRNQSRSPHSHCSVEAILKFSWKLLSPSEQIFFALEASSAENYEAIVLLITRNHLHIIRMENGPIPFKSISLAELRVSSHHSDPTLIILTVVTPEVEAEELSRTRVAQFIRDCSHVVSEEANVQVPNIPDSSHSFASEPSYSYFVNPEIREYLITFINFVKHNSTSRDFSVIS